MNYLSIDANECMIFIRTLENNYYILRVEALTLDMKPSNIVKSKHG